MMLKQERDIFVANTGGRTKLDEAHYFSVITTFCEFYNDAYASMDKDSVKMELMVETLRAHLNPQAFTYIMDEGF